MGPSARSNGANENVEFVRARENGEISNPTNNIFIGIRYLTIYIFVFVFVIYVRALKTESFFFLESSTIAFKFNDAHTLNALTKIYSFLSHYIIHYMQRRTYNVYIYIE